MDSTTAPRSSAFFPNKLPLAADLGRLAQPDSRREAADQLAASLGGTSLILFVRDARTGAFLPAPGFPQTLRGGRAWRTFIRACTSRGSHQGRVPDPTGDGEEEARAVADGQEAVLVILGGTPDTTRLDGYRTLLPLLAAAVQREWELQAATAERTLAQRTADQAEALAVSLDQARSRMEQLATENRRLYQEAQEAIRSRDEFLSIAAHELRTPVTALKGTAQLALRHLERGPLDAPRVERSFRSIIHTSDHLGLLISDLLDVTRLRDGQLPLRVEPLDLAQLTRGITERYREHLDTGHLLDLDVPSSPVEIKGDAGRLEQVLDNLLTNAIKYSPAGGTIEVRLLMETEGAVLSVADSGIGLPEGTQERIFDPFGRASNARQLPGMGLGLYISRRILELHGGRLSASSPGDGLGTTMSIWLPLAGGTQR